MTLAHVPVLLTGGTGFVGGHLAERLHALGAQVRLLVRRPERAAALRTSGMTVVTADLTDPATLRGICDGAAVVFHCAGWLGTPYTQRAAWAVNVAGTEALASEALAAGVERFVFVSSIAVYGPVRDGVVTEASPLWSGVELYGDSKIAAEAVVSGFAARGLPAVILRPGIVYGPRSRAWTIRLVDWIRLGRPAMVAGGRGLVRPIFIENLLDALLLSAARPVAGQAFTLVDEDLPWHQYLGYYARMVGRSPRSVPYAAAWLLSLADEVRARLTYRPPRLRRTALGYVVSSARYSTDKARSVLGWSPRIATADAMHMTQRWLTEHGYLGLDSRQAARDAGW